MAAYDDSPTANAGSGDRESYVREFLEVARAGLQGGLLVEHGGQLDSLRVDGSDAEAVGTFRGRRFSRRRRVWPPQHPAQLQAQLFVTALEERLLSRPLPPPGPGDETLVL